MRNFRRILDIPLSNCEVSLTLNWPENCVLTSKAYREAVAAQGNNPAVAEINNPTNATFKITDTKLYVPVVIRTIKKNDIKEQLNRINTDQK